MSCLTNSHFWLRHGSPMQTMRRGIQLDELVRLCVDGETNWNNAVSMHVALYIRRPQPTLIGVECGWNEEKGYAYPTFRNAGSLHYPPPHFSDTHGIIFDVQLLI